jgi:hypothetical protein
VWIASARGSTAACQAAGGMRLPFNQNQFQFLVREPFHGKKTPYHMIYGLLSGGQSVVLTNEMKEGALYLDGVQEIKHLHFGDRVEISLSSHPVNVIE